jgi:chromate transporter
MVSKQNSPPTYTDLFLSFFWIGLTAFGGLAMTAHIRKNVVDKRKWLDSLTFDSGLALCQVIPGAIVMQLAAYIGLKLKGIPGAIISFIGFGFPAFLIMLILSIIYKHTKNISGVEWVLGNLRVIIVAIMANAVVIFGKKNFHNVNDWIIAVIAAGLFVVRLHPALVLLIASFLGLVFTRKVYVPTLEIVKTKTFLFFVSTVFLVTLFYAILFFVNIKYFRLATIMLHVDLFSFGGGLAATPVMYHELVDVFGWFDKKTFMDGIILGQLTPGSIIIAATFFGYMHLGFLGSLFATLCVFTPSFLILMGIIPFFDKLRSYPQFNKVINGILCSFVGLLAVITYHFIIDIHWNVIKIIATLIIFAFMARKVLSS